MSKNIKKRHWAFVLYPESAPSNWRDILQQTGLTCAISPLHDKDINPDNTPKKAHYHVILSYSNTTTYNCVKSLCDSLNQPIPQPLEQVRGYYRYLTHKDNPEKYQYDEKEITSINGFDISNFIELSENEVFEIENNVVSFIRDNNIIEYKDLVDLLKDNEMFTELKVVCKHTLFFNSYLNSARYKYEKKLKNENLT